MDLASQHLPFKFGSALTLRPLTWQDFPGDVDTKLTFSAHIFWSIKYKIVDFQRKKVTARLIISKRSWVKPQKKSDGLLWHEQGHYLLGAICVLQFLRRIDSKKNISDLKFDVLVSQIFKQTFKEFIELQIKYDKETEHRKNKLMQQRWDDYIADRLTVYKQYFERKQNFSRKLPRTAFKQK